MFCDIVNDHSLFQLVDFPTRQNHILDLVFTTHPNLLTNIHSTDNLPMTDHSAVAFDLITSIPKLPPFKRLLYNYNKANFDAFNDLLSRTS